MFDAAAGIARLCQYGCCLILFGSAWFDGARRRLWLPTAAVGLAGTTCGLLLTANALVGDWRAIGTLLEATRFARIVVLRATLLAATCLCCGVLRSARSLRSVVMTLAAASVASFAWTGHGGMDSGVAGWLHLSGDLAHLFAAAAWLGALVPLCLQALRAARDPGYPAQALGQQLVRFSGVGPIVIATLVASGLINSYYLIGPGRWLTAWHTAYGICLLVKLSLFGAMLALGAINRWRLTPRLHAAPSISATLPELRALRASLLIENALGVGVLAVVALLGTLTPPIAAD